MFGARDWLRNLKRRRRISDAVREIDIRVSHGIGGRPHHTLAKPLIVSLTSYPARFGTLSHTLKSILFQSVRPDATILWIAGEDSDRLPREVLALKDYGLEIARCSDMRSYKKIIPAVREHPGSYILTVDDDVWYPEDCLEQFVASSSPSEPTVLARRAHVVLLDPNGLPLPYPQWEQTVRREERSPLVFPTGVGGVMYPPDAFHEDVTRDDMFSSICPDADDIWLYWMWRMKGLSGHKLPGKTRILEWEGSQASSLRVNNLSGGNDRCIQAMTERYGFPA